MKARPWMISVLSTGYDLKEYREAVIRKLKEQGFDVSAYEMPDFPVETTVHSHDSCLVALERADIAIVIIDRRSGGIYYNVDQGADKISITERECLEAIQKRIPIYFFVKSDAYNELHNYKTGFTAFCKGKESDSKEKTDDVEKYRKEYHEIYKCTYVDCVETLLFIDRIQNAYKKHDISNWMSFFSDKEQFLDDVEGKLRGYSRMLIQRLARSQCVKLLNRHTSTAFGLSLGDVFESQYYIEPPHEIESGKNLVTADNNLLSDEIKGVLNTDNSILVYGDAGYGKTTIVAKCFSEHVKNIEEELSYAIPLFLPLRNKGNDYHFDIERYIEEELANTEDTSLCHTKYPYLSLDQLKIRFYCDGFDEIAETLSIEDLDRISGSTIFSYPLVVTSRHQFVMRYLSEYIFVDKFGVRIKMEKWSLDVARSYIANFCAVKSIGEEERKNILAVVDGNVDFQQLLDSPLLVTMFLWFIEKQRPVPVSRDISRAELFESWIVELSKREFLKHRVKNASSDMVIKVWEFAAWNVYLNRIQSKRLRIDDFLDILAIRYPKLDKDCVRSWFDALFDCTTEYIIGTFHEQFMEFLVARLLIGACANESEPYPDFLKQVLRPEINRYYREIWRDKSEVIRRNIYTALSKQYIDNMGDDNCEAVAIRVHAIYYLCRLDSSLREECIKRAFALERQIPVLLSLYFGAIKLGRMDKEKEFYEHLIGEQEYSDANRGYHLVYYNDSKNMTLPYGDDSQCEWKCTLSAFERHFGSDELAHYYLRRIDLVTMRQLIEERKRTFPLTEEKLGYFSQKIAESPYAQMAKYESYNQGILDAYERLKEVFEKYNN